MKKKQKKTLFHGRTNLISSRAVCLLLLLFWGLRLPNFGFLQDFCENFRDPKIVTKILEKSEDILQKYFENILNYFKKIELNSTGLIPGPG